MKDNNIYRYNWIDFLRGIAIILVVIGHSIPDITEFFVLSSPIKMPLFFFISGFLFSQKKTDREYCTKIIYRLIIPWILLSIIPYILRFNQIPTILYNLVIGKIAWFMPCFIIDSFIIYYIIKYFHRNIIRLFVSCFLTSCGLLLSFIDSPNICMINTALVCQLYMIIAYIVKINYKYIFDKPVKWLVLGAMVYCLLCQIGYYWFHDTIDVHTNHYFNFLYCLILILGGCYVLAAITKKFIVSSNIICIIGKNTLLIYLWSPFVVFLFNWALSKVSFVVLPKVLGAIIISIISCLILCYVSVLMGKYVPFIIGERKKGNQIVDRPNL